MITPPAIAIMSRATARTNSIGGPPVVCRGIPPRWAVQDTRWFCLRRPRADTQLADLDARTRPRRPRVSARVVKPAQEQARDCLRALDHGDVRCGVEQLKARVLELLGNPLPVIGRDCRVANAA